MTSGCDPQNFMLVINFLVIWTNDHSLTDFQTLMTSSKESLLVIILVALVVNHLDH